MTGIAIIVPTEVEARFFSSEMSPVHICGVGMAACAAFTAQLIAREKPSLVVLAGIAGVYSSDLQIGDTVIVTDETIADLHPARFQKTYTASILPNGFRAVRSNTVNAAGGIKNPQNAEIENMEGAAFFAVCKALGVPFIEIRTVSNIVGTPITSENITLAAKKLADAVEKLTLKLS